MKTLQESTKPVTPEERAVVRAVCEARLSIARVTAGKILAVLNRVALDGRLYGILAYWAAHTGRWGGRGFQPQNLPRPKVKRLEDVEARDAPVIAVENELDLREVIGSMLRGIVVSPTGKLLRADWSGVEARGLLWLAEDEEGLDVWRRFDAGIGNHPYIVTAAKNCKIPEDQVTEDQRQCEGKVATLALGYQGGVGAFQNMAGTYGVTIGDLRAQEIVDAWRDANPLVAGVRSSKWTTPDKREMIIRQGGLWKVTKAAAWRAVKGRPSKACRCDWFMLGGDLICELPSGRQLRYRAAKLERVLSRWGEPTTALTYLHSRYGRIATYGGKLVENATQAVCRDLLAEALVALERENIRTVMHVHDEIVCEVSNDIEVALIERVMLTVPRWAKGFPVAIETKVEARYGK